VSTTIEPLQNSFLEGAQRTFQSSAQHKKKNEDNQTSTPDHHRVHEDDIAYYVPINPIQSNLHHPQIIVVHNTKKVTFNCEYHSILTKIRAYVRMDAWGTVGNPSSSSCTKPKKEKQTNRLVLVTMEPQPKFPKIFMRYSNFERLTTN